MIYLCNDLPEDITESSIAMLPQERRERLLRYKKKTDRVLCAVSYNLFEYGLMKEFSIKPDSFWKTGKNGKPYFINDRGIEFNISHCSEGAVCVIGKERYGVDIQNVSEVSIDIAKMVCSDAELREIDQSDRPEGRMCLFWCLKESYGKYRGDGLSYEVREYDFSGTEAGYFGKYKCCFSVFDMGSCIIAVCSDRYIRNSEIITVPFSKIF